MWKVDKKLREINKRIWGVVPEVRHKPNLPRNGLRYTKVEDLSKLKMVVVKYSNNCNTLFYKKQLGLGAL